MELKLHILMPKRGYFQCQCDCLLVPNILQIYVMKYVRLKYNNHQVLETMHVQHVLLMDYVIHALSCKEMKQIILFVLCIGAHGCHATWKTLITLNISFYPSRSQKHENHGIKATPGIFKI